MVRSIAFNEETVLTEALLCFWRRGYAATSMKDIEQATGLSSGSLYHSFVSKDDLFVRVLDHYIDTVVRARAAKFLKQGDPLKGIDNYFTTAFSGNNGELRLGCLLVNTATELGPHHEIVRKKLVQGMKVAERGLLSALKRAQQESQLDQNVDIKARARKLSLLLNGMLVQTKVAEDNRWLKDAMGSVRSLLH